MTRPGCPQQRRRPRRRREHHHDSCESYMKHVLSQRNLRRCSCSKQRCSEVWLTRSFSGRGDDLITSLLARVALLYLRHFYTQIVHGIKKEQIKEWRENQEKDSNCVSALHACASSFPTSRHINVFYLPVTYIGCILYTGHVLKCSNVFYVSSHVHIMYSIYRDLGGKASTKEYTAAIVDKL
jgi:hypothetical protein